MPPYTIFLSYLGGPEVGDVSEAFNIARAPVEAKLGVFLLQEVSSLGVMVQRLLRGNEEAKKQQVSFGDPFFIPWTAVQMIDTLWSPDNSEDEKSD